MGLKDNMYTVTLKGDYDLDAEILTIMLLSEAYDVDVDEATNLFESSLHGGGYLSLPRDFEFTKSLVEELGKRGGGCIVQGWNKDGSAAHDKFGPIIEEGPRFLLLCRLEGRM